MLRNAKYHVTKTLMTFMGPADFGSETHAERLRRDHEGQAASGGKSPTAPRSELQPTGSSNDYQI